MDSELYEFRKKIVDHRTRLETIEDMLGIARKVDEPKIKVPSPTSSRPPGKRRPSTVPVIDRRLTVQEGWSPVDEVSPPTQLLPGKASLKRIRNRSSRLMGMNPTKKKKQTKKPKKPKKPKKGSKKRVLRKDN